MEERTLKAIRSKIGIARNEFRSECFKYVTDQEMKTGNKALAVHVGHGHIWAELFPKLEAGLIEYCLRVGSRDVDFITGELKPALTQELHALGQSLANSCQTPGTAGLAQHAASVFQSDADFRLAGLHNRVLVAVEERRHSDPAALTVSSVNQTGGVTAHNYTINNHNPPPPDSARGTSEAKDNRRFWIVTIVTIVGVLVAIGAWQWPREPKKDQSTAKSDSVSAPAPTAKATEPSPLIRKTVPVPTAEVTERPTPRRKTAPVPAAEVTERPAPLRKTAPAFATPPPDTLSPKAQAQSAQEFPKGKVHQTFEEFVASKGRAAQIDQVNRSRDRFTEDESPHESGAPAEIRHRAYGLVGQPGQEEGSSV